MIYENLAFMDIIFHIYFVNGPYCASKLNTSTDPGICFLSILHYE